jgi:hypothetical protein
MAELPSIDFRFHRQVSALGRSSEGPQADFGPRKPPLTQGPEHISDSHHRENHEKEQHEKEFSGEQRTHEVKLQNEKRGGNGHKPLAHLRFPNQIL